MQKAPCSDRNEQVPGRNGGGGAGPAGLGLRGLPGHRAVEGPACQGQTFIALRSEESRKALKPAGRKMASLGIGVGGL